MAETLTMMAVHAHPDDEASSTGGVLATYAAQGIRTVVVTCTNGEFGDAPGGGSVQRRDPSSQVLAPDEAGCSQVGAAGSSPCRAFMSCCSASCGRDVCSTVPP